MMPTAVLGAVHFVHHPDLAAPVETGVGAPQFAELAVAAVTLAVIGAVTSVHLVESAQHQATGVAVASPDVLRAAVYPVVAGLAVDVSARGMLTTVAVPLPELLRAVQGMRASGQAVAAVPVGANSLPDVLRAATIPAVAGLAVVATVAASAIGSLNLPVQLKLKLNRADDPNTEEQDIQIRRT